MTTSASARTWAAALCRVVLSVGMGAGLAVGFGCSGPAGKPLTPPAVTVAPHDAAQGELLWAVAPLRNETGTTTVDTLATSDRLVRAVDQVRGVRAVPMNRTLAAMRALEMDQVRSPADALRLGRALGVSGVLVGSITAYDPYHPTVGLSLALFSDQPVDVSGDKVDPSRIGLAASDAGVLGGGRAAAPEPALTIAETLDGRNHQVQMDVRSYAAGRTEPLSALGWERYLRSAPLFEEFAAFWVVDRLVSESWVRTTVSAGGWSRPGAGEKAGAEPDIGLKPGE